MDVHERVSLSRAHSMTPTRTCGRTSLTARTLDDISYAHQPYATNHITPTTTLRACARTLIILTHLVYFLSRPLLLLRLTQQKSTTPALYKHARTHTESVAYAHAEHTRTTVCCCRRLIPPTVRAEPLCPDFGSNAPFTE